MTDDLDDLRRRNADLLTERIRHAMRNGLDADAVAEIEAARMEYQRSVIDETPRRVAADFWNG